MSDVLSAVKTLLDDEWDSSNTGSRTPSVQNVFDVKRIDFAMNGSTDHILIYQDPTTQSDAGSGGGAKRVLDVVKIDIRTMLTRAHAVLIKEEVDRIILANETNPFSSSPFYEVADITEITDLSDKNVKLFRFVMKLELQNFNRQ